MQKLITHINSSGQNVRNLRVSLLTLLQSERVNFIAPSNNMSRLIHPRKRGLRKKLTAKLVLTSKPNQFPHAEPPHVYTNTTSIKHAALLPLLGAGSAYQRDGEQWRSIFRSIEARVKYSINDTSSCPEEKGCLHPVVAPPGKWKRTAVRKPANTEDEDQRPSPPFHTLSENT